MTSGASLCAACGKLHGTREWDRRGPLLTCPTCGLWVHTTEPHEHGEP